MLGLKHDVPRSVRRIFYSRQRLQNGNKPHIMCRTRNCARLCREAWASQSTKRRGIKSGRRRPARLLVACFWKQGYESVCVHVCVWWRTVCAGNQKFFSTTACRWWLIGSRQGHQLPQVDQPLPKHCGKMWGGEVLSIDCAEKSLSVCVQSMDCQLFPTSRKAARLHLCERKKGGKGKKRRGGGRRQEEAPLALLSLGSTRL